MRKMQIQPIISTKKKGISSNKKLNPINIIIGVIVLIIIGGGFTTYYLLYLRSFSINPSTINVNSDEAFASIEISGAKDWEVKSVPPSWISFVQEGNTLHCYISENDSYRRSSKIEIGNSHNSCTLTINQESGLFSANPSNVIVGANELTPARFLILGQDDWNIAEGPEGWGQVYREDKYLCWKVDENYGEERFDQILLQSGNKSLVLSLTQEGALTAEKMSVVVGSGEITTRIKIIGPREWGCSSSEYWLEAQREGNNLRLDFDKNEETTSREGYVTVSGGGQKITIEVKQNGKSSSSFYFNPYTPFGW